MNDFRLQGASNRTVGPVTVELIRGAIRAIIEESGLVIERSAVSTFIREKGDHFTGIFDSSGRLIMGDMERHGPGKVDCILEKFPTADMRPGDVYFYNDPYSSRGAVSHSQDYCFISPVVWRDQVVAFSCVFGHMTDIGGIRPGSISPKATEVLHEGVLVPPVQLKKGDAVNEDLIKVLVRNSRLPEVLDADIRALMAGALLCAKRIESLFEQWGKETVLGAFDHLLRYSESAITTFLDKDVRSGEFRFEDFVDSDGASDQPVRVVVRLVKDERSVVIDLSESDPQVLGPVNYPVHPMNVAMLLGNFLRAHDSEALLNDGTGRPIKVVLRPGTVVQPKFPAAVGMRSFTMFRIISGLLGVMSLATGGRAPAASADYALVYIRTRDQVSGALSIFIDGIGSGQGARPWADGLDVIYGSSQRNFAVEFVENEYPVRVEQYSVRCDSGGPGRYRGGCGVVRDLRIIVPTAHVTVRLNNQRYRPWGVAGGKAGAAAKAILNPGSSGERVLPSFVEDLQLREGDLLRIMTAGGGRLGRSAEAGSRRC